MCEKRNITCQEWEKCSYVTKDKPGCVCRQNIDCTALYKPICGSDGNMYNNYCIMKATACRQAKQIKQLNNSDCKPGLWCIFDTLQVSKLVWPKSCLPTFSSMFLIGIKPNS